MLEGIDISSKKLLRAPIPLATGNVFPSLNLLLTNGQPLLL